MMAKASVPALLTMSKPLSVERRDYIQENVLSVDASRSAQICHLAYHDPTCTP